MDTIIDWIASTTRSFDVRLDRLHGKTANMHRLEQYRKWFDDGSRWKSAYQEQYLSNFPTKLKGLRPFPDMHVLSLRYRRVILMHHAMHAQNEDQKRLLQVFESRKPLVYTTWDSGAWYATFPNGIPEPNRVRFPEWIRNHEESIYSAYRKEIPEASRFEDALSWWTFRELCGLRKSFRKSSREDPYCRVCDDYKYPCWFCSEYDSERHCSLCRRYDRTGVWPERPIFRDTCDYDSDFYL